MKMTYHCEVERATRVQNIIDRIGLGTIILEKYVRSMEQIQANRPGRYVCLTDTGITIVKTEDKSTVITMYVTTQRELVAMYNGVKKVPPYLKKKVDRNQTFYTQDGKTIWK